MFFVLNVTCQTDDVMTDIVPFTPPFILIFISLMIITDTSPNTTAINIYCHDLNYTHLSKIRESVLLQNKWSIKWVKHEQQAFLHLYILLNN